MAANCGVETTVTWRRLASRRLNALDLEPLLHACKSSMDSGARPARRCTRVDIRATFATGCFGYWCKSDEFLRGRRSRLKLAKLFQNTENAASVVAPVGHPRASPLAGPWPRDATLDPAGPPLPGQTPVIGSRYMFAMSVHPIFFEPATPLYGLHRFGLICKKTIFLTRERPIYRILSPKHIGYSRPSLMKYWRSREIYPVLTFDCVSTRRSLSSRFLRFVQKQPAPSRTQWRSQRTSFNHNLISCNLIFHRNMRKSYETVTH